MLAQRLCLLAQRLCLLAQRLCLLAQRLCLLAQRLCLVAQRLCLLAQRLCLLAQRLCLVAQRLCLLAQRLCLLAQRLCLVAQRLCLLAQRLCLLAQRLCLLAQRLCLLAQRLCLLAQRLCLLAQRVGEQSESVSWLAAGISLESQAIRVEFDSGPQGVASLRLAAETRVRLTCTRCKEGDDGAHVGEDAPSLSVLLDQTGLVLVSCAALLGAGAVLVCIMLVRKGQQIAAEGLNAPGAKELETLGCQPGLVLDLQATAGIMGMSDAAASGLPWQDGRYIVSCTASATEAPTCDEVKRVYLGAVPSPGAFRDGGDGAEPGTASDALQEALRTERRLRQGPALRLRRVCLTGVSRGACQLAS